MYGWGGIQIHTRNKEKTERYKYTHETRKRLNQPFLPVRTFCQKQCRQQYKMEHPPQEEDQQQQEEDQHQEQLQQGEKRGLEDSKYAP
jgi:hypothetical protein